MGKQPNLIGNRIIIYFLLAFSPDNYDHFSSLSFRICSDTFQIWLDLFITFLSLYFLSFHPMRWWSWMCSCLCACTCFTLKLRTWINECQVLTCHLKRITTSCSGCVCLCGHVIPACYLYLKKYMVDELHLMSTKTLSVKVKVHLRSTVDKVWILCKHDNSQS